MDSQILVSAQISSLFPSTSALTYVVSTKRNDLPLPPTSDTEHATAADVFYSEVTGSILSRVVHDGQILELISLSTDALPLRLIFPAPLLPNPALVLGPQGIHILAVTTLGSLFRVVLPLFDGAPLWQATSLGSISVGEHIIAKLKGELRNAVAHVHGVYCVAIGLEDGSLLRLEVERVGGENEADLWMEQVLHHSSFLNSFTSFLSSSLPGSSKIVSITSLPPPTDIGHVWTLSRDRTIRLWTASGGCVAEKTLPSKASSRSPGSSSQGTSSMKSSVLLHDGPQRLIRAFVPPWSDEPHALVFIPTEGSAISGGYFQLLSAADDHLQLVLEFVASENSAHCHLQDFNIVGDTIYSLWDRQGQSLVEKFALPVNGAEQFWTSITYPPEHELTPAYLDELLLSPGSLADKFFEAVMRPGVFSSWTLHAAIAQYADACLSIPGQPAAPLLVSYPSTAENIAAVVGCTIKLSKDPLTGAPQYDNYWNALKRDWEGFVARCREIERSARWPLAIGVGDPKGDVMIVERERIGLIIGEDLPLRLHRLLSQSQHESLEPQFAFLDVLWKLRSKLGPRTMLSAESCIIDIVRQEIAFPYADIILDAAQRLDLRNDVDDGWENWLGGRLKSLGSLEDAARLVLDIIGGFDKDVKREEDEVELLLPTTNLEWSRALTAAYATSSVNVRYDLSLSLITLLFYLADDVSQWDPSLLAEIFVVFRGVALLRYTARQPAGTGTSSSQDPGAEDEVIAKLRNMNVSSTRTRVEPSYSLLHRLLIQFGTSSGPPSAAHHFLDATGLLQSLSPAHATKFEVLFGERLRLLGYREAAREVLSWLPRTPAMSYVLLRVWLDECRFEDAASTLETLAGSFGIGSGLSFEDREALAAVLPGAELFDSQFSYYLHVSALFKMAGATTYEVLFAQLALPSAPPGVNTSTLWLTIIKGLTDSGLYDDAYTALISCPYEKLKRECTSQLVYRMCEEHAVDRLTTYNFARLSDEVEDALSFKVRNADPRIRPFYSRILYTWYITRGDYRNAALTMYQRARKLANVIGSNPDQFISLAEQQLEAFVVSINALSLIDPKSAWFVLPLSAETGNESRKRRKLSKHIPESKYAVGKRDAEVVELADIQQEAALLSAQLELVCRDTQLIASMDLILSPSSVVLKLAQISLFDTAIATAKSLNVDMADIFTLLTRQCLRLARHSDLILEETPSDWLLTDKVSSWPGTAADRGWRYLRQALERHDSPQTGYSYSKVTLETILGFDRSAHPPPWLVHILEDHHPEFLIRACLRYEVLDSAIEHTLSMIRKDDKRLSQEQPRAAGSTWLPYTLIDQVLAAASPQEELSERGKALHTELQSVISSRLKHVQKLSTQCKRAA